MLTALLPTSTTASEQTLDAFERASSVLTNDYHALEDLTIKAAINDVVTAHRIVMNAEAAQAHAQLMSPDRTDLLQPRFRAGLEAGASLSALQIESARGLLADAKGAFWQQLTGVDIVLTLPVPEGAPLLDGTTGYQDWLTPWTAFGGSLVCLPWGLDDLGRPRSVMLAAHPGDDLQVLATAERLQQLWLGWHRGILVDGGDVCVWCGTGFRQFQHQSGR